MYCKLHVCCIAAHSQPHPQAPLPIHLSIVNKGSSPIVMAYFQSCIFYEHLFCVLGMLKFHMIVLCIFLSLTGRVCVHLWSLCKLHPWKEGVLKNVAMFMHTLLLTQSYKMIPFSLGCALYCCKYKYKRLKYRYRHFKITRSEFY